MADTKSRKIIEYVGEMSDLFTKLGQLEKANQRIAKSLGSDFTKNLKQVSDGYGKLGKASIKKLPNEMKDLIGTTSQTSQIIKDTNGDFLKLTKTVSIFGKANKKGIIEPFERTTISVNNASESISKFSKNQSFLIGKSSQLGTNLNNVADINAKFADKLTGVGNVTKIVSRNLPEFSGNLTKLGSIVQTSNGRFLQLRETINKTPSGVQKVSRSVRDVTKDFVKTDKQTLSLGQNLARLAKRAALTIPVWLLLRGAVTGVISTFRNGLKDIAKFDKALQKLKRNISATSTNIDADFKNAKDAILNFSLESGVAVEEVTSAIQKFATVGFGIEESLAGGIAATKLSVTLFGDAEETANAFARSLRVLTEDMDSTEEKSKAIAEAIALTDKLWKTNAFEVKEFSGNLEKFAGTAKIANLSINDTLALLATLSTGGLASRAGRLLRTTLLKSLSQIDEINRSLNLGFDPKKQSTIEFLSLLVDNLDKLKTVQGVPEELTKTVKEFFAIRGTEPIAALVALRKTLKENLALTPNVKEFNDEFKNQSEQINRLVERYKNLNKEIGKAFVVGLTGGEDYVDLLKKIVNAQENIQKSAEKMGSAIKNALIATGVASALAFRTQLLGLVSLIGTKLIPLLTSLPFLTGAAIFTTLNLKDVYNRLEKEAKELNKKFDDIGEDVGKRINKGLRRQLNARELFEVISDLEITGKDIFTDDATIKRTLASLKEIYQEQLKIEKSAQNTQTELKNQAIADRERKKIGEILLNIDLDKLKAAGALTSEILKYESAARKTLGIEEDKYTILQRQLETEQAIGDEKKLQSRLGNVSLQLFDIAKEQGVEVARKIGDVLAGNVDFSTFVRKGGKELDVFEEKFADIFKQQQAEAFFKGDIVPGDTGLRGGTRISIEEESLRKRQTFSKAELSLAQRRLAIEEKINKLREENLITAQRALAENRIAGRGNFTTELIKRNPLDPGIMTSVPTTKVPVSTFQFSGGGINISINAKNAEELDKKIDNEFEKMKNKTKEEIKNSLIGKQGSTL